MPENNTEAQPQTVNQLRVTLMHFSTKPSVTGNESEHQKEDAQELANKSLGESSLSWHGKEENYLSVVFVFSTSKLLSNSILAVRNHEVLWESFGIANQIHSH